MYHTSLYRYVCKDCPGPFFQAGNPIHGNKQDILYATVLEFIKYLHPGMLALGLVQLQAQHILDPVYIIA